MATAPIHPTEQAGGEDQPARRWASTMHGHPAGPIRLAHSPAPGPTDGDLANGPGVPNGPEAEVIRARSCLDRRAREDLEQVVLGPGATLSIGAGDRSIAEPPDPVRTCFERDRDRILHASAFRRLAGKTQVFVVPDDHQRTRLTHALEVTQVASAIAQACRLNVALTEAIALGHDCGHGPGGHASEEAFSPYVKGGYDHAVWGADVVLTPLNLCSQTADGIRNHSWSRPAPSTMEAEVVSWADRIAYVCHDFEDAVRAGITNPSLLPSQVKDMAGSRRGDQLDAFIGGVVAAIMTTGIVGMTQDRAEALAAFRSFNYEHIYMRPAALAQGRQVVEVLRALVEHLADRPGLVPDSEPASANREADPLPPAGGQAALERAVTYVAGMTDRYAFRMAVSRLGWDRARLADDAGF